jgi:hypothetical protein
MPPMSINDNHAKKIQGLLVFRDSPEMQFYSKNHPDQFQQIRALFDRLIGAHQEMAAAINAQGANGNITGLQVAPTMMNRMAGGTTTAESPEGQPAPLGGGANAFSPGITGGTPTE